MKGQKTLRYVIHRLWKFYKAVGVGVLGHSLSALEIRMLASRIAYLGEGRMTQKDNIYAFKSKNAQVLGSLGHRDKALDVRLC